MSAEFTYSDARQKLALLLELAARDGEVRIRRKDGRVFVLRPETRTGSPLDVPTVDLGVTTEEIVALIRESRPMYDRQED
jgi:hypothetical protein